MAAALALSTSAVLAQETTPVIGSVMGAVQDWPDGTPDQGIAIGEPDPTDGGSVVDGSDDSGGDDAVDEGDAIIVIDDGSCIGVDCTADDGTNVTDEDGTVVTDEDGTDVTDDGTEVTDDDSTDVPEGDGTVVTTVEPDGIMYTMNGGTDLCIDCNVALNGAPVDVVRPSNHTVAERAVTGKPAVRAGTGASGRSDGILTASDQLAQCLSRHARSTWICEWQNGAGQ